MKTTYVLLDQTRRDVIGYFHSLTRADYYALPGNYILKLRGPNFGEGFHTLLRLKTDSGALKIIR